ncbi:MAG: phosphate/phosphite/phosphonate ABC transporter substrate-binding protein [Spirochaetes bacterium]|nr:phosphate/phosphite/phosphonate ABC transporter substrate-binding protein [Spirochaetota bacterium]MBX3723176.1 phosphate/phosphite/phosphonate ABC transporter substrate-binding protein [Turneriella sp.]
MYQLRVTCFFFLALCLFVCRGEQATDVSQLAAGKKEEVYGEIDATLKTEISETAYTRSINFGVTPWGDIEKMRKAYQPLATYLSEKLNARVRLMIVQEYRELVADLKRGIVHIASFSPGAYADALDEGISKDSLYVASAQLKGKDFYRGIIVVKNEVKDIASLKGKSFAFVETGSSSGYKYPLALFLSNQIDPYKYFSKVYFLGSHPNVVEAVINGKVDAGATWDGYIEENYPTNPPGIKVLLKTEPIPYDAVVVSRRKAADLAPKLREILTGLKSYTLTKGGDKILNLDTGFPYSGYVVHSDAIYDIVRRTGKAVSRYKKPGKADE